MNYQPQGAPPPKKKFPLWVIVVVSVVGALFVIGSFLSVLAVYGVRKYIANAKTAEARNSLGEIAHDAASAYEKNGALCASASSPVPAGMRALKGTKYQSSTAEWAADEKRNAGFSCLGFSLEMPQYFQYSYTASPSEFAATAHGDLNGDGQVSTFQIRGVVKDGVLTVAPSLEETSPEE